MSRPVIFLVGPTGSGKTQLSLSLARRLHCEIISADSMLVYRGMDIGTAKPTLAERKIISHHLINVVSPRCNFSVYQHRKRALEGIEDILKRKRIPLIVGGSGLYLNSIWKGLSPHPGKDAALRKKLESIAQKEGLGSLYKKLHQLDPTRAQKIHPNDRRRILRALEIAELSGRPPSDGYPEKVSLEDMGYSVRVFGISRNRSDLYERINRRVNLMFRRGFLEEVKKIKRNGFSETAGQALGYREILSHLQRGEKKKTPALIQEIQKKTRQFAKRQLTWFRKDKEIQWIVWDVGESPIAVSDKIRSKVKTWLKTALFS